MTESNRLVQLRVALETNNGQLLLSLCQELTENVSVSINGFEARITHQIACKPNMIDCMRALLQKLGPNCLNSKSSGGNTPVHLAAMYQADEAMLRFFKDTLGGNHCFSEKGEFQRSVVHFAAQNKISNAALKFLVHDLGTTCLQMGDKFGDTALHMAARFQGSDSMELFKRMCLPACFNQHGAFKRTPIHCAAMNTESNDALKWLVGHLGMDCLRGKDGQGSTPVHLAALKQDWDTMEFVKEQLGALAFMKIGQNLQTSVHYAASNTSTNSTLIWLVQELGASCLILRDAFERLPIHLAAQHQDHGSMDLILAKLGPGCFKLDGEMGRKVIHYAAMNERSNSILQWTVEKQGPNCLLDKDREGSTAVHLAAQYQDVASLEFIKSLLGLPVFKREGAARRTAAHYAAMNVRKVSVMDWLRRELGEGVLHTVDSTNRTAEHYAYYHQPADQQHSTMCEIL